MNGDYRKRGRDCDAESGQETRPSKRAAQSSWCPDLSEDSAIHDSVDSEERVGRLMMELMEEIGMVQAPAHHRRRSECIAGASDLALSAPCYSCDSAASSTNCSSKPTDARCLPAEYSGDLFPAETEGRCRGDVDSDHLFDLAATAEAGGSAVGSPDDRGVSTSDQNFLEPSECNECDDNWLQSVFQGSEGICCHLDDDVAGLQMSHWEDVAELWGFACQSDEMDDWLLAPPNLNFESDMFA